MTALVRSEFYRMATIRSSWLSIALFAVLAASFGLVNAYWWALFAGLGALGISVLTVAQHYQHRTAALLYLARPRRLQILLAQVITTVTVSWVIAAVTGVTVLTKAGGALPYRHTLAVVPIMAVFGTATAAIVRRSSWLLYGFGVWFVLVEGLVGQMKWQLPISSYLDAASGDAFSLEIFVGWAAAALAVALPTLARDLPSE
jgi:hypothetical protein